MDDKRRDVNGSHLRCCKSSVHTPPTQDKQPIGQERPTRLRLQQCTSKTHVGTAVQDVIEEEKACILQNHRWDRIIFNFS